MLVPENQSPTVAVLLPCYNEEVTIGKVVRDFKASLPQADIYVYDNNSTDRTADIAARGSNRPQGAATGQGQRDSRHVRRHRRRRVRHGRWR